MARTVLGIFTHTNEAEEAIFKLEMRGYNPKDISILMKETKESRTFASDTGTNVAGGAASGAATGGVLGALAGLLVGTGVIPGLGAFLIGGPLAATLGLTGAAATTLSGAATGALAGGVLGALVGFGVPEKDARVYESRINEGGILVAVPARSGEEDEVESVLADSGAGQIKSIGAADTRSVGWDEGGYTPVYSSEVRRSRRKRRV